MSDNGKCGAKTRPGTPCDKSAGWGTSHPGIGRCKFHGGRAPRAQLAGVVELARRQAVIMGTPLEISPHDAILQCIHIAAGEVQYASERITELDADEAIVQSVTVLERPRKFFGGAEAPSGDEAEEEHEDGTYSSARVTEVKTETTAQLNVWIRVRQAAMDRLVTYSATALKAGIEERRVKIAEQQGQLLAQVIRGILAELGVAEHPQAPAVVRKHLMLVAGDPAT